ncbi:ribosome biogenesis protein SLX9 homolog isoform X2 [Takifugu rubripes]|uniref:Protein FAM207A n=1 Tax=Takifugu flavidus TaxID=433684 RepID=A0A5C6NE37_9TELE|nr:protein FAM207A isoform X2 [Takifugu rubripes]XP_056883781.1 protein FAM207A isoform X2 [Takifugu flavidus]TWW64230.1 hypothetical protein D4764_03G0012380 [Takifugu flavidus]|eukprot:XP_011604347.1 PREDICTED: protein FAM207A isoform X2 [Takifugu rubripes]
MVGKIRHVRQKIHQEAVKLERPSGLSQSPFSLFQTEKPLSAEQQSSIENQKTDPTKNAKKPPEESSFLAGIFAGTKITPDVLVQTLKLEEQPHVSASPTPGQKDTEKKIKSKKEKTKERRERWLNKISSIKQAKEQQAAEARRKATPVVGDMRPLISALPELSELVATATPPSMQTSRRKSRKNKVPVKRAEPTDFSQMKPAQKRKFLETETGRFGDAVRTLAAKTNPLADIGELLRKRMRQEEEQGPS